MKRRGLSITHVVTAAEAAYTALVGHVSRPHGDGEWLNGAMPEEQELWPVLLHSLYCETVRPGVGLDCPTPHGIAITLYSSPTDRMTTRLCTRVQGWHSRAQWDGVRLCQHGFGVILRIPAVLAGDVVILSGTYEVLP
jgi:hypothetical protein